MKWTLEFKDPLAQRTEYTGGKGSNLARLTAGGFDVPPGFVLTTEAYRTWIDTADGWKQAVRDLPEDNQNELPAAATALRQQLSKFPLPDTLSAEIRERVNRHPVNTAFAVRSSSNMEDMAEAAFAGSA